MRARDDARDTTPASSRRAPRARFGFAAGALAAVPLALPAASFVIPWLLAFLQAPGHAPASLPRLAAWALLFAACALAGGLTGLGAAWVARRLGPTREDLVTAAATGQPERAPERCGAWLHLVSGPGPRLVACAAAEVSAAALARGQRVLVLDGGRRLRLHERFGCEPHWGLVECLAGELPVLGLVQNAGAPGLYLLAHGNPARGEAWSRLGRLLDEARPYFGQVVLAVEGSAPHAVGEALRGREQEAWWAESGPVLPRVALALSQRLGIRFIGIELRTELQTSLDIETLLPEPVTAAPGPPEEPAATTIGAPTPEPHQAAVEAFVLECELQVRERLRFLMWMRRIQAESRRAALRGLEQPEPARAL